MTTTNVTLSVTKQPGPVGPVYGLWRMGVLNPSNGAILEEHSETNPTTALHNLTIGTTYTFFAQRLDTNGVRIGAEVNQALVVPTPATGSDFVPLSISITAP